MLVLATFVGGWGHVEPLLALADLAERRGHVVAFAGQAAVVPRLAERGHRTYIVGPDTLARGRLPLVRVDPDAERRVLRDHFVRDFGARRCRDLARLVDELRPGLVICDEVDVGAVAAAERAGLPCVTVSVLAAGRLAAPSVVGEAWDAVRAGAGLEPDPGAGRIGGSLALYPAPGRLRDPALPWPAHLRAVRPPILDAVTRPSAAPDEPPARRLVYATLGTVFPVESGDLLARIAAALARIDADSLLTVGPAMDPAEVGPEGPRVRIERFVPQREVLGRCAAVVCHGGSGTVAAALSLGLPVVVLPMGADQPDNADRCQDLGAGVVLDAVDASADEITAAIRRVLDEPGFAAHAGSLADAAAAQPPLHEVDELVELLGG